MKTINYKLALLAAALSSSLLLNSAVSFATAQASNVGIHNIGDSIGTDNGASDTRYARMSKRHHISEYGQWVKTIDQVDFSFNLQPDTAQAPGLISTNPLNAEGEMIIHRVGASFIKLHFNRFELPAGALIEISNPAGTQVYRYGSDKSQRDAFTFDTLSGDDGLNSFAAMSVTGDTLLLKLVGSKGDVLTEGYDVAVDYITQGQSQGQGQGQDFEQRITNRQASESKAAESLDGHRGTDIGSNASADIHVANLSGRTKTWQHYTMQVPPGTQTLRATINGVDLPSDSQNSDADLYINQGTQASPTGYACKSTNDSSNEACTVENPKAGTWYISIFAWSDYSGLALEAINE